MLQAQIGRDTLRLKRGIKTLPFKLSRVRKKDGINAETSYWGNIVAVSDSKLECLGVTQTVTRQYIPRRRTSLQPCTETLS